MHLERRRVRSDLIETSKILKELYDVHKEIFLKLDDSGRREHNQQVAQLSQRDRAAGWVSNGQKWKTGTERQYLRTM